MGAIATWMNADNTLGISLWDDGDLRVIQREKEWHVWSPPIRVPLKTTTPEFRRYLFHEESVWGDVIPERELDAHTEGSFTAESLRDNWEGVGQ